MTPLHRPGLLYTGVAAGLIFALTASPAEALPPDSDSPRAIQEPPPRAASLPQKATPLYPALPELPRLWRDTTGIDRRSVFNQSMLFLALQHGYRLSEEKTRAELGGKVLDDWRACVNNLDRWSDGGKLFTNYVAHPIQGAVSGRILIQNDARARPLQFGDDEYVSSRMKALAFSALYSTQFEIGPVSEATLGLAPEKQGLVDIVVTPLLGTAFLAGEDAADRYLVRGFEARTDSKMLVRAVRMVANPSRTLANLLRFKKPWFRDDRGMTDVRERATETRELASELAAALATRFAPLFWFHPDEQYFPCSPLFPFELDRKAEEDGDALLARLGSADGRVERYRSLDDAGRLKLARVFYRAYERGDEAQERVVVEYWLYYVYNSYRGHGGVLPFSSDLSHPNDMEHVFVVLRPRLGPKDEPTTYDVESVFANAHGDGIPNNCVSLDEGKSVSMLVELGSHALAPDVDGDGRFTSGVDSSGGKFEWGIRDDGTTWSMFPGSAASARCAETAIVLVPEHAGAPAGAQRAASYTLVPVRALVDDLDRLALSGAEHEDAFGGRVHWVRRLFGKNDGSGAGLVRPDLHPDYGDVSRMERDARAAESGWSFGATMIADSHPLLLGRRQAWVTKSAWLPNVLLDVHAMHIVPDRLLLDADLLGYYPIDAATKLLVGGGLIVDAAAIERRQLDWIAGVEFAYGRLRFRTAWRSPGKVNDDSLDFRATYLF